MEEEVKSEIEQKLNSLTQTIENSKYKSKFTYWTEGTSFGYKVETELKNNKEDQSNGRR